MFCSVHTRGVLLIAALAFGCVLVPAGIAQDSSPAPQNITSVRLSWGKRLFVSQYRLQLAHDSAFADIVWDRVVAGNEIEITDLDPGRYFWRVAPLNRKLGKFSSPGVVEVKTAGPESRPPSPTSDIHTITARGGWRSAIGNVSSIVTAHLRSADKTDLITMTAGGVLFALDATDGLTLWSSRTSVQEQSATCPSREMILVIPNRTRLDNVLVLGGRNAIEFEGATGRELWRSTLPEPWSDAVVINDGTESKVIVVGDSRQQLFFLGEEKGNVIAQLKLPAKVVGSPAAFNDQGKAALAIAYDTGGLEIRDAAGTVTHRANISSCPTTGPLFVRRTQGQLVGIGTREGVTTLTSDLQSLGRIAIPNDAPRGALVAQDLKGDGDAEIIATTERRHLVVVSPTSGKIVWDVVANDYGQSLAFADIDGDQVLDVFTEAGQTFAVALSGRDGSVIWKDMETSPPTANRVTAFELRSLIAVPFDTGVLVIGSEPSRTGLRALKFLKR